jgi:excisionase family DNA binding protein
VNLRPQRSDIDRSKPRGDSEVSARANKEWWSPKELQEWLGCGRTKIYELLQSGVIPSYRIGRLVRVRKEDVELFLERSRYDRDL